MSCDLKSYIFMSTFEDAQILIPYNIRNIETVILKGNSTLISLVYL